MKALNSIQNAKLDLVEKLKKQGIFWSYSKESLKQIPDNVLIEEALRWGDVPELLELFRLFDKTEIKKIWCEKVIPDERIFRLNYYLAKIFFDIENPERYIKRIAKKNSRYERIKKSIA